MKKKIVRKSYGIIGDYICCEQNAIDVNSVIIFGLRDRFVD